MHFMHPKAINLTTSHETQILALFYRDSERRVDILLKFWALNLLFSENLTTSALKFFQYLWAADSIVPE